MKGHRMPKTKKPKRGRPPGPRGLGVRRGKARNAGNLTDREWSDVLAGAERTGLTIRELLHWAARYGNPTKKQRCELAVEAIKNGAVKS